MKFADYILPDAITPEIKATDKQGVIREMVQSLVDAGGIKQEDYEGITKAFIKREELGSTAYGRGIAIPETRHQSVSCPIAAVGISTAGVDFEALDNEKTHIFVMVLSTPGRTDDLYVMDHLTRRLKNETFRESLKQSKTREAIVALLEADDSNESH